ncbi:uncharacterized protein PGTG_22673 [Puccinia graminis f. sp. tritici CRL 75-36-700-3]|uniref:Uncharacterized protein n=1 Tax=Puccinia graminis f. sp. tritici (strain CRL 75-36-700-3 / race SCCL) TaxID=418459 RepID=H6QV84_PUCGT|nr:uncharacterized protein PGTG_22673 [Puccinia graminis f. sp. tritici CRL 75-36-700-3]EHS62785.1 hypothetical protein PGTG_22673 [Puccinia graminis f. sp. tritici CRL 75-36-700-3]
MVSFKLAQLVSIVVVGSTLMNIEAGLIPRSTVVAARHDAQPAPSNTPGGKTPSINPANTKPATAAPAHTPNTSK